MEDDNGKGRGEKHKDNVDGIRAGVSLCMQPSYVKLISYACASAEHIHC